MTINEAINYLTTEAALANRQPETGVYDALKLSIEALKRIKRGRELLPHVTHLPLLGETSE